MMHFEMPPVLISLLSLPPPMEVRVGERLGPSTLILQSCLSQLSSSTLHFLVQPRWLPYRKVEPERHAGLDLGHSYIPAEFTSPSWKQPPASDPMAIQLQSVSEVGNQGS